MIDTNPTETVSLDLVTFSDKINTYHRQCESAVKAALENAINAGALLTEAKALCAHGDWLPWLQDNFEGSTRTAQAYMRVARHYSLDDLKNETVAHLSYREALKELAEPGEQPTAVALPASIEPSSDAPSPWRTFIEGITGIRPICETPEAYKEALGLVDLLDDAELQECWIEKYLSRLATVFYFRHEGCANCQRDERSDYACMPLPPALSPTPQNLIRLGALEHFRIGDFVNWAGDHGITETVTEAGEKKIRFLPIQPERFTDCGCAWCNEARGLAPDLAHELHIAAIGYAWMEAGMILLPVEEVS